MKRFLQKPFFLGTTQLPSNIFCAPLAGCSDLPFRKMTSKHRPGLIYCEMVKMDALIRKDVDTYKLLEYEKSMHPIGAQLCGSKLEYAASCAQEIERLGFDVVDLNCGCPVDKITKDGSGSGLLKKPHLIAEIVHRMVQAVTIPVTVKIRLGWDDETINCIEVLKLVEQAGAKAICIHGRTREQGYSGKARWEYIAECKKAATSILVIGNGDIVDARSALDLFETTHCDAILVARGTMGQPWIIEDIYALAEGKEIEQAGGEKIRQALFEHMNYITNYQVERKALLDMRRICCWYLKNLHGARQLRDAINKCESLLEVKTLLEDFSWSKEVLSLA